MSSAVDHLKQRFMDMSQPDADGVYRGGSAKRRARTELAMDCLRRLWSDAVAAVPFDMPSTGIGFGAVGSLARGRLARAPTWIWSSSMSHIRSTTNSSMSWPTNCGIPCGTAALTSISRCARGSSARP